MASEWIEITGCGVVSSAGLTVPDFDRTILSGRSCIGPFADIVPQAAVRFSMGSPVRGFDPSQLFDEKTLSGLDRFTQFAAGAARQAVAVAGLADRGAGRVEGSEKVGVIIGSANGGIDILDEGFKRILKQDLKPRPLTVPMTMGSAPASRIAREIGAHGPVFGVTSACASAAHAILLGATLIRSGAADAMIVGGADSCFADGYLRAWDALRAVSPETCRPFSIGRRGLVIGEGAAVFVLERRGRAAARGARPRAFLAGVAAGCDAGELTVPDEKGMAQAMRDAIADAGLRCEDVDYINAHGTGTQVNDRLEAAAIRAVFDRAGEPVAISSTKSAIGHAMGASGALELLATLAAMENGVAPPTLNFLGPDPSCEIEVTPNEPRPRDISVALSNSFAFGSLNATLLVARPDMKARG
jgi:nodulation protein E